MYAVVNHLHFDRPAEEFRAAIASEGMPLLAKQPGFRDFYLVKEAEDRGIVIILWEDAASAMAGAQAFGPTWFNEHIIPYLASPQQRSAGEVLVSHQ